VNYLGSSADGIHVSFPAQQWNLLPNSTAHLRLTGDCAEATATRVPGKLGVYTMAFNRLPAYLCILPYISDEYSYLTSVMKRVVIKSDKVISGTFDVGQFGSLSSRQAFTAYHFKIVYGNIYCRTWWFRYD